GGTGVRCSPDGGGPAARSIGGHRHTPVAPDERAESWRGTSYSSLHFPCSSRPSCRAPNSVSSVRTVPENGPNSFDDDRAIAGWGGDRSIKRKRGSPLTRGGVDGRPREPAGVVRRATGDPGEETARSTRSARMSSSIRASAARLPP